MHAHLVLLSALLITGAAQAQALAGAPTFGIGASGTVPTPLIHSVRSPMIGGLLELRVHDGPPNAIGAVIITHTRLNVLQLPPFPFIGGNTVYVDTFALVRSVNLATDLLGQGATVLPIPPDPGLVGQMFATQAILLDNANPFGGVLSNAVLLAIGDTPPLQEPEFQTLTSPIDPGDPLFDQMAGSPLTAEFAAAVEIEGMGTMAMDEAFELILVGDTAALGPIPPDARIVLVPVRNTTPNLNGSVYMFTMGTHPMLGLVEGADVMEFREGIPGQLEALRIYTDATDFNIHADIQLTASGSAGGATTTGITPYMGCFGALLAAKVAVGTISGISVACGAACTSCLVPNPATPPACAVCIACVLLSAAAVIGCWWAC